MRRGSRTVVIFAVFLVAALFAAAGLVAGAQAQQSIRVVVQSDNPKTLEDLKSRLAVKHDFGAMGFSAITDPDTLESLQRTRGVRAYQALEYTPPVLDAPTQPKAIQENKVYDRPNLIPPGIERVHAPAAWEQGIDGTGVDIAFIDTGIDVDHPDLKDAIFLCADVTTSTFSMTNTTIRDIRDGECTDYIGHGTHVAGTGAANGGADGMGIFGVARKAGIGMAKVCPGFICLDDDIAAGILLAAERGAEVLSISLGGSAPSPIIHAAVQHVVAGGVVVVAAAGNSGSAENTINYPGAFAEVVAAAATGNPTPDAEGDDRFTVVADFSSRGITDGDDSSIVEREVELAAPGVGIFSTCDGSFDAFVTGYCTASGTSMATPHVAGIFALIVQKRGGADTMQDSSDVAEARAVFISKTGTTTFDITADCCGHAHAGYDIASGYGLPEADKVLASFSTSTTSPGRPPR